MDIQVILNQAGTVFATIIQPILGLIYALIILLIGWLIAKGLQMGVSYGLQQIQIDNISAKAKLTSLLQSAGIKKAPTELVGDLVYWVIIFMVLVAVAVVSGVAPVSKLFAVLLAYVPKVVTAAFVLGIAMFLAVLVATIVQLVAGTAGLANTKTLAKIAQYAIVIFGFVAALGQLGIGTKLIMTSFNIVIAAVGLAFAIAFGLGCKDRAADFIDDLFKNK